VHDWNDRDVDWKGLDDAARYIGTNLRKWGRVPVSQYKEKWGTVRVYCTFGWTQIHSITHPGYAFCQYPRWLWVLDCRLGHYITRVANIVAVPVHKQLYGFFYRRAMEKWPHLRKEIIYGADWPELLDRSCEISSMDSGEGV
jgi:hypothetical protein